MSMSVKKEKKESERTAELLIGFPFFSFSCRISHDRGIRKKNLYNDNDSELPAVLSLHYFLFSSVCVKNIENKGEQHTHIETM